LLVNCRLQLGFDELRNLRDSQLSIAVFPYQCGSSIQAMRFIALKIVNERLGFQLANYQTVSTFGWRMCHAFLTSVFTGGQGMTCLRTSQGEGESCYETTARAKQKRIGSNRSEFCAKNLHLRAILCQELQ
jgi:hypothetical protein